MDIPPRVAPREARSISRVLGPEAARLRCGVEHVYRVLPPDAGIDSRELAHTVEIAGRGFGISDPGGDRDGLGSTLTMDGLRARITTPPIELDKGFAELVVESAERGRRQLLQGLPAGLRIEGYQTHINVSVPDDRVLGAARLFAPRFTVGMLLLMDGRQSAGLLVRPRPGRLELGGEFVRGDGLRAAILLATGAVLACSRRGAGIRRLPPRIDAASVPTPERFGSRLDRPASDSGVDWLGRGLALRTVERRRRTAQQQLEECWKVARAHVRRISTVADLQLVDHLVAGRRALPAELAPSG